MYYAEAIDNMNATNNAAKRSNMVGYIWKFTSAKNGLSALTTDGDYYLSLVQRDGDQYIYKHTAATGVFTYLGKVAAASGSALDNTTSPTSSDTLVFDAQLMTHIGKGNDWTTAKQTDVENVRSPEAGTEW